MHYSATISILKFIKYWLRSKNQYYLHSPFVYNLVSKVIYDKNNNEVFDEIENLRKTLKQDHSLLKKTDFGTGKIQNNVSQKVKQIVKSSAKSAKYGQCLHRLVKHFKPQNMLELGSSLGISTLYQASANRDSNFTTLEGDPIVAKYAKNHLQKLNCGNVSVKVGNFDDTLDQVLNNYERLDYVFLDGNHQEKPTIQYFEKCLRKAHNNSLFIFDDIHWSKEMENAWKYIKEHKKVTVTIDLFFIGLVFFRKQQAKQHFIIRH